MAEYFQYLNEMIKSFFSDLGGFFKKLFAGPWVGTKGNFELYNSLLDSYSGTAKAMGGWHPFWFWFFWVFFLLAAIGLIGGLLFLLFLGIRKYVRFVEKELDKDDLKKQVERLNYELYTAIIEKDKILNLKTTYLGLGNPVSQEDKDVIEEVSSRFPKLTNVDIKYRDKDTNIPYVTDLSLEELCNSFRHFAASQLHLYYTIDTIRQLFAGMATSKLLILEGISGTGKTSLPYALGKFFNYDASIIPVQPSWKDRTELLGYYNEFTKKFNESEFLKAMYTATYRKNTNIIVLDEMNLARIEYYFAEFLSLMEMPNKDDWKLDLIPSTIKGDPVRIEDGKLLIPQNVIFFGTANNDDSTFTISDKVYDRAISIFFDNKGIPFECEPENSISVPYSQLESLYANALEQFPVSQVLLKKFGELDTFVIKKFKLAFGNRILKQLDTFIPTYVACGGSELDGFDFIFTNKILKKFESLNIAFLKDELGQLNNELDKLFGKDSFKLAHNYIDNLIRNN